MKKLLASSLAVMPVAGSVLLATRASTQSANDDRSPSRLATIAHNNGSPISGVKLPAGYRDWTLISVTRVGSPLNFVFTRQAP